MDSAFYLEQIGKRKYHLMRRGVLEKQVLKMAREGGHFPFRRLEFEFKVCRCVSLVSN